MTTAPAAVEEAAVLAAARRARAAENAAAAQVLVAAVEWAALHQVDDVEEAATWWTGTGHDTGIPIAGPGAPLVSEFAVAELATALGLSAGSGRNLLGQALELAHRLPRLWARVNEGSLPAWRARRIAEETINAALTLEAAEYVDRMLAPYAHRTGPAQTLRLVQEAIARFMPETAKEIRDRAVDQRYFTIDHDQVSFAGTSRVHGELDLADALDLEDAVRAGAAQLAALGNPEPPDARRALAVGDLARRQLAFGFEIEAAAADQTSSEKTRLSLVEEAVVEEVAQRPSRNPGAATEPGPVVDLGRFGRPAGREIVLYVHLTDQILNSGGREAPVRVSGTGGGIGQQLLTAGQVADWCGRPDTAKVTVKPVIDLNAFQAVDEYRVPDRIAEHVRLRDRTCVHPYCNRPARSADLDHIEPYVPTDDGGPPGQTNTLNLAPLCRLHHRMKTHGGWSYTMVEPGVFLWRSPHGYRYLRDRHGTTDLTPPQVEPPER